MKTKAQGTKIRDAGKAVFKRKFIAVNAYVKIEESSQTYNLTFYLRKQK